MHKISDTEKESFFADVAAASAKAVWCALATVRGNEPRVRITPTRVELSEMFGSANKRVWRRG